MLKFMIYKYVWKNIDEDFVYISNGSSVDTFATEISRMHDDLVARSLVVASYNPVAAENAMSAPANEDCPEPCSLSQDDIAISIDAFVVPGEEPVPSPSAGDRRRRTTDIEN
ncbi:hypothetical protein A0J61_10888 [Choanephora cucurbitarum]|uniref:Uncharacterized protein n=1 Tax=Choanephora cucurbitarum TaxID=101091 RepID=A0A1C7MW73_9FUNG|nr:hypothetical protein A0J61_10888 [Choanephora cucurbitarum]